MLVGGDGGVGAFITDLQVLEVIQVPSIAGGSCNGGNGSGVGGVGIG